MADRQDPKVESGGEGKQQTEPKADVGKQDAGKQDGDPKANAAFAELRQKEKQAREEAKAAAAKAAELEAKLAEIERAKLSEEERIRKDLETYKPKAEQAERYSAGIAKILEIELGEIPEDKRDLIPNLDPLDKLEWVRAAKAKGLFAPPPAPPPEKKPGASNGSPPPGNGTGDADAQAIKEIEEARKSKNPHALVAALKKWGRK